MIDEMLISCLSVVVGYEEFVQFVGLRRKISFIKVECFVCWKKKGSCNDFNDARGIFFLFNEKK